MRKYIGGRRYVPGVPARDLTEAEWAEFTNPLYEERPAAGGKTERVKVRGPLLEEGSPAAELWEKEGEERPEQDRRGGRKASAGGEGGDD